VGPGGDAYVRTVLRNLDRMAMLLDDISELSRIETGALRLDPVDLRVGEFLDDLAETAAPMAEARGGRIEVMAEPATRALAFRADPMRLAQALENLLSNAVKFSPEGSVIRLGAALTPEGLAWTVTDPGPGIREEDLPRIFERFFRSPAVRAVPGTGLGLSIVKHLAVLMGGDVSVHSLPGRGATFTFRHPLTENEGVPPR
ncbi:MAG TPA: HAMP domain-containing sensor histidine kinase, partial [Holophaga sp.]|nr:HAMP domain-containing sensor histidine kinase [Holophaga sp.]